MKLTLTEDEYQYVKSEYRSQRLIDIAEFLKPYIEKRTEKKYSLATILRAINELGLPRKNHVRAQRNQYIKSGPDPVEMKINIKRVMKTSINGYKPVKRYKNYVLYEKDIRGTIVRTTYTWQDLYEIFKEVENGQKETGKLSLD